jgi:hypothetical protein
MSTPNLKRSPTKPGPGWIEIDEDKIPKFLELVTRVKAARKRLDDSAKEFGLGPNSED